MQRIELPPVDRYGRRADVLGVWHAADGRHLLVADGVYHWTGALLRWDLPAGAAGEPLQLLEPDYPVYHGDARGVPPAFDPGCRLVAAGFAVRRTGDGELVAALTPPAGPPESTPDNTLLAITADGSAVVAATPAGLLVYALGFGPTVRPRAGPPLRGVVADLGVSPAGDLLAATTDAGRVLHRWRLPGFDPLPPADWGVGFGGTGLLRFAPAGDTLAVAFGACAHLCDRDADEPRAAARCGPVRAITFTPDGGRLLTVPLDGSGVDVWDATDGRRADQFDLSSLVGDVACVSVAPDGLTAVAGGADGVLARWDL